MRLSPPCQQPMMRCGVLALAFLLAACTREQPVLGGDPERGRLLLRQYGCGSCHAVPGVATAQGKVGPPLGAIRRRVYLAGAVPNQPDNMARWIQGPQRMKPKSAMPDLQVTPGQARDMVAYLYTLE